MPLPNGYDLFAFVLNAAGFGMVIYLLVFVSDKKRMKKHKATIIVLVILAVTAFVGSKLVMNAKPSFHCPAGVGDCSNI